MRCSSTSLSSMPLQVLVWGSAACAFFFLPKLLLLAVPFYFLRPLHVGEQSMGTFSGLNPDRTDMRLGSPVLQKCRTQQFFGANVKTSALSLTVLLCTWLSSD